MSRLARRLTDHELLLSASSLAFYGLVSALPLLIIAFAFVEAVGGEDTLRSFADRVDDQGPEGSGQFLDQLIDRGGTFGFAPCSSRSGPPRPTAAACVARSRSIPRTPSPRPGCGGGCSV